MSRGLCVCRIRFPLASLSPFPPLPPSLPCCLHSPPPPPRACLEGPSAGLRRKLEIASRVRLSAAPTVETLNRVRSKPSSRRRHAQGHPGPHLRRLPHAGGAPCPPSRLSAALSALLSPLAMSKNIFSGSSEERGGAGRSGAPWCRVLGPGRSLSMPASVRETVRFGVGRGVGNGRFRLRSTILAPFVDPFRFRDDLFFVVTTCETAGFVIRNGWFWCP